jgi:hypothetical protein
MEFFGLVGEKLAHSHSPYIHNLIFKLLGIQGAYKLFEMPPEALGGLADAMRLLGVRGVNVTIPYKQAVMAQLDDISPEARTIGAVNTIRLDGGRLTGFNTDYSGFLRLLKREGIDIRGGRAAVLGTGGGAGGANGAGGRRRPGGAAGDPPQIGGPQAGAGNGGRRCAADRLCGAGRDPGRVIGKRNPCGYVPGCG